MWSTLPGALGSHLQACPALAGFAHALPCCWTAAIGPALALPPARKLLKFCQTPVLQCHATCSRHKVTYRLVLLVCCCHAIVAQYSCCDIPLARQLVLLLVCSCNAIEADCPFCETPLVQHADLLSSSSTMYIHAMDCVG